MRATLYLSVDSFEARIALRENGKLVSYRIERHRASSNVGNLYRGKVTRVLPGMQAAFVDIGLDRDAFLYVREAGAILDDFSEMIGESRVEVDREQADITDLLRRGQEILVQVVKDQLGTKGARLTTYITLPGRFLVHLPSLDDLGVSRRINDELERERLREIITALPGTGGWIVRTAGEGLEAKALEADAASLARVWQRIQGEAERAKAPRRVHAELDAVLRTVRDTFTDKVAECWVDDVDTYRGVLELLDQFDPQLVPRVKLYRRSTDIMTAFGLDRELDVALKSKVWLKSGGYLVVNQTEALVAIDVNTGKFVGSLSLEDTVYRINLEAVGELVRQLRLRDLGGIVVIDFIDMIEAEHRTEVYEALAAELKLDPARSQLLPMSDIGLVQLTRKRTRPSLGRSMTSECPYCSGSGRIKSLTTTSLEIRRRILDLGEREGLTEVALVVHPDVAHHLSTQMPELLTELDEVHSLRVMVKEDPAFHHEQYEVIG